MKAPIETVLELRDVARAFAQGGIKLDIFKHVSMAVRPGEIVALVGPSGAGKSSLLHIAGLLEAPTAGEVFIAGRNCSTLDDLSRTRIRRLGIGFVYQFHHLLPEFSALENVILPQLIAGAAKKAAAERATALLQRLGLDSRLGHRPAELSGGEQQRVAIARALANRPLLLLADEPTGNLDPRTAGHVHAEFLRLIQEEGLGAVIATHNLELAQRMHRILHLDKGQLVEVGG
ncbi:MAG TPA: ABC transporter ATP-binding protein [Aestuariivirgaceae bacterium]|jgi:lipoprotein-releasing system ATP-binding protein|nr:ABC transporter ATP-binding protein [Aestuariivirgaceae bacterium]